MCAFDLISRVNIIRKTRKYYFRKTLLLQFSFHFNSIIFIKFKCSSHIYEWGKFKLIYNKNNNRNTINNNKIPFENIPLNFRLYCAHFFVGSFNNIRYIHFCSFIFFCLSRNEPFNDDCSWQIKYCSEHCINNCKHKTKNTCYSLPQVDMNEFLKTIFHFWLFLQLFIRQKNEIIIEQEKKCIVLQSDFFLFTTLVETFMRTYKIQIRFYPLITQTHIKKTFFFYYFILLSCFFYLAFCFTLFYSISYIFYIFVACMVHLPFLNFYRRIINLIKYIFSFFMIEPFFSVAAFLISLIFIN